MQPGTHTGTALGSQMACAGRDTTLAALIYPDHVEAVSLLIGPPFQHGELGEVKPDDASPIPNDTGPTKFALAHQKIGESQVRTVEPTSRRRPARDWPHLDGRLDLVSRTSPDRIVVKGILEHCSICPMFQRPPPTATHSGFGFAGQSLDGDSRNRAVPAQTTSAQVKSDLGTVGDALRVTSRLRQNTPGRAPR
jgi:hypothetical protein